MATNTPVSLFKFVEPSANWITKVVVSNQVDTEDRISPNQQMMYHMLVPPRRFHFIASQKGYEHPTKGTYNYGMCWLEIVFQRMVWTHGRRQNGGGFVGNAGMGMMDGGTHRFQIAGSQAIFRFFASSLDKLVDSLAFGSTTPTQAPVDH